MTIQEICKAIGTKRAIFVRYKHHGGSEWRQLEYFEHVDIGGVLTIDTVNYDYRTCRLGDLINGEAIIAESNDAVSFEPNVWVPKEKI